MDLGPGRCEWLGGVRAGNWPLTRCTLVSAVTSAKSHMPALAQALSVAGAALWELRFTSGQRSDAGARVASTHLSIQRTVTVGPSGTSDCDVRLRARSQLVEASRGHDSSLCTQIVYKTKINHAVLLRASFCSRSVPPHQTTQFGR